MKIVTPVFRGLARLMLWSATAFLLVMTGLVVLSVVMRYALGTPFRFTEELVALLYMAMVFLAVPIATVERRHVSIEVLPGRLRHRLRRPLALAACAVMVAFCGWFAWAALGFVQQSARFGSRTEQADILLWPWMAIIPATFGFVVLIAIAQAVDAARGRGDADQVAQAGDGL